MPAVCVFLFFFLFPKKTKKQNPKLEDISQRGDALLSNWSDVDAPVALRCAIGSGEDALFSVRAVTRTGLWFPVGPVGRWAGGRPGSPHLQPQLCSPGSCTLRQTSARLALCVAPSCVLTPTWPFVLCFFHVSGF